MSLLKHHRLFEGIAFSPVRFAEVRMSGSGRGIGFETHDLWSRDSRASEPTATLQGGTP
jgi:hypothetical protein